MKMTYCWRRIVTGNSLTIEEGGKRRAELKKEKTEIKKELE